MMGRCLNFGVRFQETGQVAGAVNQMQYFYSGFYHSIEDQIIAKPGNVPEANFGIGEIL